MKKVIIAFNGKHFSKAAFGMAEYFNQQQPVQLTGIFLNAVDYRNIIGVGAVGLSGPIFLPIPEKGDEEAIKENI